MSIYWKIACAVGIAVVAFLGGWFINGSRYDAKIAEIHRAYADDQAKAEERIRQFEREYRTEMEKQAAAYQAVSSSKNSDIEKLKSELRNVQKSKPMHVDCRLDSDRLRIIKQIGDRANSGNSNP